MAIKTSASSKADSIKYEVMEECGTIATLKNGDQIKLRYMSWNGRDPKYDIRTWGTDDDGNEICRKGIGFTGEQLIALGNLISEMQKED